MTETATATAINTAVITAKLAALPLKMKVLIAALSLLLVVGGLYVLADPGAHSAAAGKDPFTLDIQNRADTVNNVVLGVIEAQGKEPAFKFRTTCEDAITIIRKENMDAQQQALKLTPEQRTLNTKYQAFLHEAANVVLACSQGQHPDLTKINQAKADLK